MDQVLLSVEEARVKKFGKNISRAKMYELTRREDFPIVRIGRRVLIPVVQLEAWIAMQASGSRLGAD